MRVYLSNNDGGLYGYIVLGMSFLFSFLDIVFFNLYQAWFKVDRKIGIHNKRKLSCRWEY